MKDDNVTVLIWDRTNCKIIIDFLLWKDLYFYGELGWKRPAVDTWNNLFQIEIFYLCLLLVVLSCLD